MYQKLESQPTILLHLTSIFIFPISKIHFLFYLKKYRKPSLSSKTLQKWVVTRASVRRARALRLRALRLRRALIAASLRPLALTAALPRPVALKTARSAGGHGVSPVTSSVRSNADMIFATWTTFLPAVCGLARCGMRSTRLAVLQPIRSTMLLVLF